MAQAPGRCPGPLTWSSSGHVGAGQYESVSASWARGLRWLVAVAVAVMLLASCGQSSESSQSETAQWLRAAAGFNETPELIDCMETAMHEELSPEQLREWLSYDPETITVEQIQALPHAIDVADRCRHLLPSAR